MSQSYQQRAESMRKRMFVFLAIGIISLISGAVMIGFHIAPIIVPVLLVSIGCSFISVFFFFRGTAIRDEMVKQTDVLSGYYTCNATLYFLFACGIINYFFPLPLSVSWLLWTMMMFMSFTYVFIRLFLLKRGVPE